MHRIQIKKLRDDDLRIFLLHRRISLYGNKRKKIISFWLFEKKCEKTFFCANKTTTLCENWQLNEEISVFFFFSENVRWNLEAIFILVAMASSNKKSIFSWFRTYIFSNTPFSTFLYYFSTKGHFSRVHAIGSNKRFLLLCFDASSFLYPFSFIYFIM